MQIDDPVILIRINQMYKDGMSAQALYEATQGEWKVSARREGARYAFAVYDGIVREVYRIDRWVPAGTVRYRTRKVSGGGGRWEFEGAVADERIRARYVGQSVKELFRPGNANPIMYVNC